MITPAMKPAQACPGKAFCNTGKLHLAHFSRKQLNSAGTYVGSESSRVYAAVDSSGSGTGSTKSIAKGRPVNDL